MRKRISSIILIISFAFLPFTSGCGKRIPAKADIIVVSDVHYISPRINDFGEMFEASIGVRDGRAMDYIEEITDTFIEECIKKKPEAVVITGDLTMNGAIESHEDLAVKLKRIEDAGISVLVLPGNHDVYCENAAKFEGDSFTQIESATTESFMEIYRDFGYSEAISVDESSASYMYQLNDKTRVLMLDFNARDQYNNVSMDTLRWIEKELKQARDEGMYVVAAGHQNLFVHNPLFTFGYVIGHDRDFKKLFKYYGVDLYLSGHMHIQHYVTEDGITEILTSALPLYPNQYGRIYITEESIEYTGETIKIAADGYEEYGLESIDRMSNPLRKSLEETDLTDYEKEKLVDYFTLMNLYYYSGDMVTFKEKDADEEMPELLEKAGINSAYIESMEKEKGKDYRYLKIILE